MSVSSIPDQLEFHGNGGSFAPHGIITASDHGPAVVVATWIMICLMGLAVLARLGTRHSFDKDNLAICLACILAILQSIVIHLAVDYGLGRHRQNLNFATYTSYLKAVYAAQILKYSVHYLAKLSLVFVFLRLTPAKRVQRILWLFILLLTLWAGVAVITLAVQCPLPYAWDTRSAKCISQEALYLTHGTINILTDLILLLTPVVLFWDLQIKRGQRSAIWTIFAIRILVCITTALELITLENYFHNVDKSWFYVDPTIWSQASMNLSIITACIPLMRPLFNLLQFSLIDSSIPMSFGMLHLNSRTQQSWTPVA